MAHAGDKALCVTTHIRATSILLAGSCCRPFVRARQPPAQLVRRILRCRAVERHQRGRPPRNPYDVGAPPVLSDGGDLDLIRMTGDELFKSMDDIGHRRDRANAFAAFAQK